LVLKENYNVTRYIAEIKMLIPKEEFSIVAYIFHSLFRKRLLKYIKKEKYGQKQLKLPVKLTYKNGHCQFYFFLFFFRYFFSILAKKNRQLYLYKAYKLHVNCQFMELSILFKSVYFKDTVDLYNLLSDLIIDLYINTNNDNKFFSSFYSLFRYNLL
jgi:hypothetical protein